MRHDLPRQRCVKLSDAEWSALERIARRHALEWGGAPSRSGAIRLLILRECGGLGRPLPRPPRRPRAA